MAYKRRPLAPANVHARLNQIYQKPPAEAAHLLSQLVEETYDLIEAHLSEIDVAWLHQKKYTHMFHSRIIEAAATYT